MKKPSTKPRKRDKGNPPSRKHVFVAGVLDLPFFSEHTEDEAVEQLEVQYGGAAENISAVQLLEQYIDSLPAFQEPLFKRREIQAQPAGPKAFRLYSMVRDTYRRKIGERAFRVYEALTYYVDPKTLQATIPLKLLAETVQSPLTVVSRCLHRLWQEGLITITAQWDAYGCVPMANLYSLQSPPLKQRGYTVSAPSACLPPAVEKAWDREIQTSSA